MRKVISSAFILLLLLFSIWGASAWYFGTKTEQSFSYFIDKNSSSVGPILDYDLIEYKRSIFGATAKIRVDLNDDNKLAQLIDDSFVIEQNNMININIYHGPILFDKSGIGLGTSAWKLQLKNHLEDEKPTKSTSQLLKINQLFHGFIDVTFNNTIQYKSPIEFKNIKVLVTGQYDLKADIHEGKLSINPLLYQGQLHKIQTSGFVLNYQQLAPGNKEKIQLKLSAVIPKLNYTHNTLADNLDMLVAYQGSVSIEKNKLNSNNRFSLNYY